MLATITAFVFPSLKPFLRYIYRVSVLLLLRPLGLCLRELVTQSKMRKALLCRGLRRDWCVNFRNKYHERISLFRRASSISRSVSRA